MRWSTGLKLFNRKRCQSDRSKASDATGTTEVHVQELSDDSFTSKSKRRWLSVDGKRSDLDVSARTSFERRSSLDLWHEARRARNSIEAQSALITTTDKLTIAKAGRATIVNRKYVTVKHLGTGTFGRVTLCLNIKDQKLYAVKTCRKAQTAHHHYRPRQAGRFRRHGPPSNLFAVGVQVDNCEGPTDSTATSCGSLSCLSSESGQSRRGLPSYSSSTSGCTSGKDGSFSLSEETIREIAVMKKLSHPNVVQLVEVIDDPSAGTLLLVMEYVEGRTLQPNDADCGKWETVPECDVRHIVREVLQGLDYLHYHQVVHGDLKPANLLFDTNTNKVKIVDFGSSKVASKHTGGFGSPSFTTPAFRSPESLQSGYQLSFELDMWALGVCVYMWIYGCLPFTGSSPFAIYDRIRNTGVEFPEGAASELLKDFLSRLLDKDVCSRMDVSAALQHPWLTAGGEAALCSLHHPTGLACLRKLQVSQEDLDAAVLQQYDSVEDLMAPAFEERHYQERQLLVSHGDCADRVFLIATGEVEIFQDPQGEVAGGSQPFISGLDIAAADEQYDFSDLRVPDVSMGPTGYPDPCHPPTCATSEPDSTAGHTDHRAGQQRQVVVVKGPGEIIGLPCLHPDGVKHVWKASVCANTAVTAFVADGERIRALVKRHPEVLCAVEHMVHQQETDLMVTEAMRQLTLFVACQCTGGTQPRRHVS